MSPILWARRPVGGPRAIAVLLPALAAMVSVPARASDPPTADASGDRLRMAQYDSEETWTQADILVTGTRVFDNRCAPCHGDEGHGDGDLADVLPIRPRNYSAEPFKWGSSPSRIATTVAGGRSGVMPPFKHALSEQEIWAVAYVVWRWIPEERRAYDTPEEARQWKLP